MQINAEIVQGRDEQDGVKEPDRPFRRMDDIDIREKEADDEPAKLCYRKLGPEVVPYPHIFVGRENLSFFCIHPSFLASPHLGSCAQPSFS
jgi:hypothetical protein